MYEDLTVESIKNEILSRTSQDTDTREGSYTNDMISGVAYEIWKLYQSFDSLLPIVFIDETSGEYIYKKCDEYGIPIKAGTKAVTRLHFTGIDGTVIPKSKVFLTAEGLEFITDSAVTIASEAAEVSATAAEVGDTYNVAAGTITRQYANIAGLASVTNEVATGGSNPESDEAILKRYYDFLRKPATSGNADHYRQWALETSGVGNAKIYPLWDGPGSVKVLIVSSDNKPVDSAIVDNCTTYIEKNRPIGADVTVMSAEGLSINVDAVVTISASTTIEAVRETFETTLKNYLQSIAFNTYTVVYNRIAYILLDIDGVIDYTLLLVNEEENNIIIGADQVPVIGEVTIDVAD